MKASVLAPRKPEPEFQPILTHVFWNGLGYFLLGETTVMLMAIHLKASPFLLSILGSMIPLSGLVLVFSPWIYRGRRPVRIYQVAWTLRGWVCLGYFAVPWVPPGFGLAIVVFVYGVYCTVRMMGAALFPLLQNSMATPETQGEMITKQTVSFNLTAVLSRLFSSILLAIPGLAGMTGLLVLEAFGIAANQCSVQVTKRFPDLPPIRSEGGISLRRWTFDLWRWTRDPATRWPLLGGAVQLALMVLFAMTVPTLTQVVGFSKAQVFAFALIGAVGAVVWGWLGESLLQGSRVRHIGWMAACLTAATSFFWMFAGPEMPTALFFAVGFLQGIWFSVMGNVVNRLFLSALPEAEAVGFSSMSVMLGSVAALGGGLLGGALAELGHRHLWFGNAFCWVFLFAAGVAVFNGHNFLWCPPPKGGSSEPARKL